MKLKLKFIERDFFPDYSRDSRGSLKGYNPAIIKTENSLKVGHVIDPEGLAKVEFIDVLVYQTEIDLVEQTTDLSELLKKDEKGFEWLSKFNHQFMTYFDETIPTDFLIENIPFIPLEYCKYPNDYFKRIEHGKRYSPPEGIIESVPDSAFYMRILPPVKFKNGKWVPNIYYNRKLVRPDGIVESYSLTENNEGRRGGAGVFLGKINEDDVKNKKGEFEGGFPFTHFLEVVYPVTLRTSNKMNPLQIQMYLED